MRLIKARVQGYRSIIDTGYFDVEDGKTILVGPNEAGKTAILQALQKLNPPEGVQLFDPLRDYPRARYDEDIKNGKIDPKKFTVVEGLFALEEADKADFPEAYHNATSVYGRYLDNTTWHRIDGGLDRLTYVELEKDLQRMCQHFKATSEAQGEQSSAQDTIQNGLDDVINGLTKTSFVTAEKARKVLHLVLTC